MADEPRRSGRPTKGVHTKMDLQDTPTGGKKKGGKRGKKQAAPEEEEEEVIRCVCGVEADEDTGEAWIACDNCGVWQHNVCVGVSTFEDEIPANYKCEQCDPDFHRPLLDAMARGEELWEIRKIEHRKLEEEGSKKKGKRGKGNKRLSDQKLEPTQSANANGKAKSPSTPVPELKKKDTPAKGSSKRKVRDESHDKESAKVQKTTAAQTPKQKSPPSDLPANITDLSTIRQGPAKLILKGLNHAIPIAVKNGVYTYSQGDNLKGKAERLAIQIENAIYTTHPSTSYGHQARAIAANLKINQDLCNRLLTKSLTPNALAGMTSDDMQSKELKQQTAEMKARADKQAIMVTEDDGPRIRRTHKGDEVVEGDDIVPGDIPVSSRQRRRSMMDPNADMATRSRENSPGDEAIPPENINDYPSQDDIRGHVQPKGPLKVETKPTPARKQSAPNNFDINTVYKKVQAGSPTTASHIRRPSANIPAASTQHDPDIDRLLEDDGSESPPYSPAEYNSDPEVIWHGEVNMDSIAKFAGVAKHVAGADMTQSATNPLQWSDVLPKDLRVAGRIDQDKANEYLCSLRYSPPTDVVVVNITPTGEQAGKEFKIMFEYFYSKNRYGVLTNKGIGNIRDTYLVPVAPSPAALPDFLVNLEGHKVPENRPDPLILAALVIRTHWDEQHHLQSFDGSSEAQSPSIHNRPVRQLSMSTPGPAMSPIAPQNASFSSNNPPSQLANPSQHPPVTPEQIERESRQQQGEDTAKRILGVHINAPTIAFLLPQAFQMRTVEWEVIRGILETDDKARIDLQHLSQVLELRMAQQAQSQGTPTGQPTPPT